jgi:hypothetical protein
MPTRSFIGKLNPDQTVTYIYCHFDSYPNHVGAVLEEYYSTEEKVNELLELGDLSSLGKSINECDAYGRDGGECDVEATTAISESEYKKIKFAVNYIYLYKNNHI